MQKQSVNSWSHTNINVKNDTKKLCKKKQKYVKKKAKRIRALPPTKET